jgi:hypothetical protein
MVFVIWNGHNLDYAGRQIFFKGLSRDNVVVSCFGTIFVLLSIYKILRAFMRAMKEDIYADKKHSLQSDQQVQSRARQVPPCSTSSGHWPLRAC